MNKLDGFLFALLVLGACSPSNPKEPHVKIETGYGDIEVVLYPEKAPKTVAAFLSYIDSGLYDNASFYRVLKNENVPEEYNTGLIQGGIFKTNTARQIKLPGIEHESPKITGISHVSGTISLARTTPGSANSEFFIIDLPLKPGKYKVIAFMGEAMFYDFTPRAIGIYGDFFEASLLDTFSSLDHEVALKYVDQIHGTEDGTVLSRLGNDLDNLAEKNSAISYNRSVMLSDSWGFQRYFAGSQVVRDRIENFSPSSEYTALQWLTVADELRMRGQKAESTKIINGILASSLVLTDVEDQYLVAVLRARPGVWPA